MRRNVAVVGCGYWGKNIVRNFYDLGALNAVCDVDEQTLERISNQCEGVKTTRSYASILGDGEIEAVAIAAPAALHYELAKEAIRADKDVYVEKPLALRADEGEELIAIAEERGRILMVGHILHYHPALIALKGVVSKGNLGRIQYIYSTRLNFGKIRCEENILWSFAPHDISMILGLLGEDPIEVSAKGSYYLHPKVADVTMSLLKFESGVNAHIFVSWFHPFKEQKLVVVGDKQMAVFDDTAAWESKLVLYPHEIVWEENMPEAKRAEGKRVNLEASEPLKSECSHFLDCIEKRQVPVTDGREGLRVLKVLNGLQESLDKGGLAVGCGLNKKDYFAHDTAIVEDGAKIGSGSKIWHFSHVMSGAGIGEGCTLGQNVVVMSGAKLGRNVKVQNNVSIYEGVVCGDDVFLGPSMVFTNVINPRSHVPRKDEYRHTIVEKGASIGANATVVCGHSIGEYAFIGAGAVVTKDVPAYAMVYGNPARHCGWACRCGEKLDLPSGAGDGNAKCAKCGDSYRKRELCVELI